MVENPSVLEHSPVMGCQALFTHKVIQGVTGWPRIPQELMKRLNLSETVLIQIVH